MRRGRLVLAALVLSTCGGGSSTPRTPAAPSPSSPPPPWTLSGRVLGTLTDTPVGGAEVEVGSLSAMTNAEGRFTLSQSVAPSAALRAKVTAGGHLTRATSVGWPRSSPEPRIDLIATTPPFSLSFYKQLVRGELHFPELDRVYRWTEAPRVSLHPFDDEGHPLAPHVVAKIREVVPKAVAAWSGGLFTNVALEEVETADETEGWIVLHVVRSRSSDNCGSADFWYYEPGRIVTARIELTLDKCGCGSRRITENTISHEIGHAMGFWHVNGRYILNGTGQDPCNSIEKQVITGTEAFHSRIAYARPPGNRDPDSDPAAFTLATDGGVGRRTVTCRW
jgi:hypothetical protein